MMAKKGSYKDLFEENKNHLEKQISDKEKSMIEQ